MLHALSLPRNRIIATAENEMRLANFHLLLYGRDAGLAILLRFSQVFSVPEVHRETPVGVTRLSWALYRTELWEPEGKVNQCRTERQKRDVNALQPF